MINALLALSFIFIFNPIVNVIDLLPDFIGWLLLFTAVRRARRISPHMELAAVSIVKMAWLTFAGFVSMFLMPHLDGTMLLTVIFVLNTLKLMWGIPAFKQYFDGLEELSSFYGGKSIYMKKNGSTEAIKLVRRMTLIFFVSSCVLNTLPEFLELSAQSSIILSEGQRPLLSFKPTVYFIASVVWLVLGVIWLVYILPFTRRMCKERDFVARMNDAFEEKIVKTGKLRAYTLMNSAFIAMLSGMFMICIMLDDMNIVPRFVLPLLIAAASVLIGRCGYVTRSLTAVCAVTSIVSLTAYILRFRFLAKYSYELVKRSFEAYNAFCVTLAALALELLLLVLMQVMFFKLILKVWERDAGREVLAVDSAKIEAARINEFKEAKHRSVRLLVLFILTGALNVFSFVICHELPYTWMIVTLVSVIWFVYSSNFFSKLRSGIEQKYL